MIAEAPARPATPTERAVAAMLVENTGSHMLDSGGAYGRAWQHTRAALGLDAGLPNSLWHGGPTHLPEDPTSDMLEQVALVMREAPVGSIDSFGSVYVDTFHWLVDRLDYDPALDRKWRRYIDKLWAAGGHRSNGYNARIEWPYETGAIQRFIEQLRTHGAAVEILTSDNSYNGDCELDRTIQYTVFSVSNPIEWAGQLRKFGPHSVIGKPVERLTEFLPDETYVLLQIHGGADVRGGYTDARLFRLGDEWTDFLDYSRVEVWCEGGTIIRDDQVPGQLRIDGSAAPEPLEVHHFWDNVYGDSYLRRVDQDAGDYVDEALTFAYEEDAETGVDEYATRQGIGLFNVARKDDENIWRCPFDNASLHVSGATIG